MENIFNLVTKNLQKTVHRSETHGENCEEFIIGFKDMGELKIHAAIYTKDGIHDIYDIPDILYGVCLGANIADRLEKISTSKQFGELSDKLSSKIKLASENALAGFCSSDKSKTAIRKSLGDKFPGVDRPNAYLDNIILVNM